MALEITALPAMTTLQVTDSVLLPVYDPAAPSDKSKKVLRSDYLKDVAREGGNHNFGTSEITLLTATIASLTFGSGSAIDNLFVGSGSLVVSNILTGASETVTATVTGVTTADFLSWAMTGALPDGLTCQAWISADDTVSFKFHNTTGGTINGATYTARMMIVSEV